ncbi:hypothetical protein BwSH20_22140 [Bradyrhizobium ottawaense]|nr:hypothetical protein SG09_06610 [Bradyrhizobium ottawaense]GMO20526.1 hypothetical protein BwSF12_10640 [Bradyrhizobium ottawaense]GMO21513.1 hypothetical protein BwSF21_16200 [Bradyrhizobium ottawaense]GMO30394.1 hypothetical protein BwSH14_32450 [Bradyrhizobium ottawaense]GMO56789.1 hypothetical protein BwSG20_06870 [Bradyrhizobium ottawaense]
MISSRYNFVLWLWVPGSLRAPGRQRNVWPRPPPHTSRNTTAPSAPAHSAMAAMPWIMKPGPRLAAAFE